MSLLTVRRRRPRFSVEELKVLVGAVERDRLVLFGPRGTHGVLDSEVKDRTWTEICKAVNSVSQVKRSPVEIRKKWADWTSVVRKKSADMEQRLVEHQGTTATSSRMITPTEQKLLAILETKSGLAGGEKGSGESGDTLVEVKQEEDSGSLGFGGENEDLSSTESALAGLREAREEVNRLRHRTSTRFQNISSAQSANEEPTQTHNNLGDNSLSKNAGAAFQNGGNSRPLKLNRSVKHPDVLLALKRRKLRVLEEQVKIERERLEVERGILQILREIQSKQGSDFL